MKNSHIENNNTEQAGILMGIEGGSRRKILFLLCGILLLGGIIYFSGILDYATPEAIRDEVLRWGPWGPLVYLLLFTFVPLTLFPDAMLAVASGMAFGIWKGFVLTWLGALLGGSLAFWLARLIGQEAIEKLQTRLGHKPHPVPMMKGFLSILILRLVPLVPFDVISYGAGLSQVRYRDFLGATALGIIPGVCVFVNLGDTLFDCSGPKFYCAVALLIGLCVLSSLGARYLKKSAGKEAVGEAVE